MSNEGTENYTPSNTDIVTKYKVAGDIATRVMKGVIANCIEGANVYQVCANADAEILQLTSQIYKGKIQKGIALPTCISVNHCACHYSPTSDNGTILKIRDLVKIELGVHIDGLPALLAHTFVVGLTEAEKIQGKKADVLLAAHYGAEVALRAVRNGKTNIEAVDVIQRTIDSFKVKAIEGTTSFQVSRNSLDGEKSLILAPNETQKKTIQKCQFEEYEVYVVDIAVSSGDGKIRPGTEKATVFKKTQNNYALKLKASRTTFSEITTRFGSMAFNIRSLEADGGKGKLGLVECVNHQLVEPLESLYEREGESVARFMFTVILMPAGPLRITGSLFDPVIASSEYKIEDQDLIELLASEVRNTKATRRKAAESA